MTGFLFFVMGVAVGTAVTVAFIGPSRLRLLASAAARDAELAALRAEHTRVSADLKLLELATEDRAEAIKAENAELRRRMDEIADQIVARTKTAEPQH